MQQGDYFYYQQHHPPIPTPTNNPSGNPNSSSSSHDAHYPLPGSYASAPPFSSSYDYSTNHPRLSPYHQNPDQAVISTESSLNPQPSFSLSSHPMSQPPFTHNSQLQPPFNQNLQLQQPFNQNSTSQLSFNQNPTSQSLFSPYDPNGSAYPQSSLPTNPRPYFSKLDPPQATPAPVSSYAPPPSLSTFPAGSNPSLSSVYTPHNHVGSSSTLPGSYETLFDNSAAYDQGMGYFEDKFAKGGTSVYARGRSDVGSASDPYSTKLENVRKDDFYGDGVYRYEGGKAEPYGARGTGSKSSTWSGFDDFGRPINSSSGGEKSTTSGSGKIVRAVPKAETQSDAKGGVQKFRVKLLTESAGQNTMDVLCQIGLDGIRMVDPSSSRTLRIYPLENITRCDKLDSSTFAFWSKSSVDNEARRIRLQSNSYTTNTLLDTVTAATVQLKEIGGGVKVVDSTKTIEQSAERKKGLADWMNLIKPGNEEKDHWVPDEAVSRCTGCGTDFSAFVRKHHCRNCGDIFCDKCTHGRIALTAEQNAQQVRVCDRCMAEVTQRLSNSKDTTKSAVLPSHEDLAKKLQDELEKNRKSSSGFKSDGTGTRMKEVACPTCTVHLQVQVPISGSETIECGVCQHPFLVSGH